MIEKLKKIPELDRVTSAVREKYGNLNFNEDGKVVKDGEGSVDESFVKVDEAAKVFTERDKEIERKYNSGEINEDEKKALVDQLDNDIVNEFNNASEEYNNRAEQEADYQETKNTFYLENDKFKVWLGEQENKDEIEQKLTQGQESQQEVFNSFIATIPEKERSVLRLARVDLKQKEFENKNNEKQRQEELEKSERLKEKNREIDEEQRKEEEKEKNKTKKEVLKGGVKKIFSLNTLKEIGLKMSGTKMISSWRERWSILKKEKDMKQGDMSKHIVGLIDAIKNGDNSEENKLLKLELKNKLREVKQTDPEKYKKAVEVLFKSRHSKEGIKSKYEKEQIKESISKNVKDIYTKERTKKTREAIKESINTALVWSGAFSGGAFAYGTVITRAINNLYFDVTEQFRDNKGNIKGEEFKNSIKNLRKNWQEKSLAGKVSDLARYGGLAYMLYHGYSMDNSGTLDEYKTLIGKIKDGEFPYYSGDKNSIENNIVENIEQVSEGSEYGVGKIIDKVKTVASNVEDLWEDAKTKMPINYEVKSGDNLWNILENNEKFWEQNGWQDLSDVEKQRVIIDIVQDLEGNQDLTNEFINLQPGDELDLAKLSEYVDNNPNIDVDSVSGVESFNNDTVVDPKPAEYWQNDEIIETKFEKMLDQNNQFEQIGEKYFYTVKTGDTTWDIVKDKLLIDTLNLDENLTDAQLNNLTANILSKMRESLRAGHTSYSDWGCDMSAIFSGNKINMAEFLKIAQETKISGYSNLFYRASEYVPKNLSGEMDNDWKLNCYIRGFEVCERPVELELTKEEVVELKPEEPVVEYVVPEPRIIYRTIVQKVVEEKEVIKEVHHHHHHNTNSISRWFRPRGYHDYQRRVNWDHRPRYNRPRINYDSRPATGPGQSHPRAPINNTNTPRRAAGVGGSH